MTSDYFSEPMRRMRREFARLIAEDQAAFDACMEEYQRRGADAFPEPEKSNGRPKNPDVALAFLLADYRLRDNSETKEQWLNRMQGTQSGDRFQGVHWMSPDAIEQQLKEARKKEKNDSGFADDVAFYQSCLALKRGKT